LLLFDLTPLNEDSYLIRFSTEYGAKGTDDPVPRYYRVCMRLEEGLRGGELMCVILASGYGRKLWPLTREIAQPLLPVSDKVVLDYIMDRILELKADRAFLTRYSIHNRFHGVPVFRYSVGFRYMHEGGGCG